MRRTRAVMMALGLCAAPAMAQEAPATAPTTRQYDVRNGFPDRNGNFSAMLVVIPKAQMAEFDQPGGVRQLQRVARAEAGAELAVKVLFTGMQGDWKGLGNVAYDIQVYQPDGKLYGTSDYRSLDALHGKVGSGEGVFDNRNKVLLLKFEPTDMPGPYKVKVTVYDRVAQLSIPLQTTVELLPQPVAAPVEAVPAEDAPKAAPATSKKKYRRKRRS